MMTLKVSAFSVVRALKSKILGPVTFADQRSQFTDPTTPDRLWSQPTGWAFLTDAHLAFDGSTNLANYVREGPGRPVSQKNVASLDQASGIQCCYVACVVR